MAPFLKGDNRCVGSSKHYLPFRNEAARANWGSDLYPALENEISGPFEADIGELAVLLHETHFEIIPALHLHSNGGWEMVNTGGNQG
jgi:hypothetical protein